MATYQELMDQAKKMMAEAEKLRLKERTKVIEEIRELMKRHELTIRDIVPAGAQIARSTSMQPPKYRGPNGELWAGGRGRKPDWVKDALSQGKSLDDFLI